MGKYSKDVADRILKLLETGRYSIPEICKAVDINPSTYHRWVHEHKSFAIAIKEAKETKWKNVASIAESALVKALEGYEYKEITKEGKAQADGKTIKVTHIKEVTKYIPPRDSVIIFTNKALNKEKFGETESLDKVINAVFKRKERDEGD